MVYINSDGKIQPSRGFIGSIKYWWAQLIAFLVLFFSTLSPQNNGSSKDSKSGTYSGGGGGRTIGRVKGPPKQGPNCFGGS